MTLNFLHYKDLPLKNSPLREVICQISFAPLLEIVQKLPTDFQSKIRNRFPMFAVRQTVGLDTSQPLPSEYEFKSASDKSSVSLAFNFIALSTREYSHWDIFREQSENLLEIFSNVYGKILMTRIGLRYINQFSYDNTKLKGPDELLSILNDDLSCLLLNSAWSLPQKAYYQLSLEEEKDELTIRLNFNRDPDTKIILDFDYFTVLETPLDMDVNSIIDILVKFHTNCYDVFRWSIRDEKIGLLQPIQ
ncbi:MAG: TIGR04255 family protein [Anaerolineales bacterium]|nr:TIGR04255 family protein [Anaerolineales bacterium]